MTDRRAPTFEIAPGISRRIGVRLAAGELVVLVPQSFREELSPALTRALEARITVGLERLTPSRKGA